MRIQLAVVDTDTTYLTRLQERVTDAYAGRVELLAFTALDKALASLAETRTNVLVVHESIEVDAEALPARVELAHLVDAPDVESVRGIRAVSKFAPVDAFYRAVVELYDAASSTMQMRSGRPGTGRSASAPTAHPSSCHPPVSMPPAPPSSATPARSSPPQQVGEETLCSRNSYPAAAEDLPSGPDSGTTQQSSTSGRETRT